MDRRKKERLERAKRARDTARLSMVLEKAATAAARKLGKWELLRKRQGVRTGSLEILANRDNPAFISIRRKSGGTIHAFSHGRPQQDRQLLSAYTCEKELYAWIRAELLAWAADKTGDPQALMDIVYKPRGHFPNLQQQLQKTVYEVAEEAVRGQRGWKDGMGLRAGLDSAFRAARAELGSAGKMLDRRTMETARLVMSEEYTQPHPTPNAYNWVHLNRETIRKLEKATPGIAQHYVRRCWDPQAEPARLHPGEMIRAVRDETQLTRSEWRAFCRIGTVRFLPPREFPPDEEQPSTLRLICRAVDQANQPRANADRLGLITQMGQQCRFYHEARWEAGDAWRAWVNLLNRYLDPGRPTAVPEHLTDTRWWYAQEMRDIRRAEDALRDHVERHMPWGPGDWETLAARSERWHRALYDTRAGTPQKDQDAAWSSALQEFREKGLTASPITTGPELHRLGREMGNCLGSYTGRCWNGESRIFHITRNGRTAAAAEISRTGDPAVRWKLNHIEAPRQAPIAAAVHEFAGRLPDRYNAAETAP